MNIPTGALKYERVDALPEVGEEWKVYGLVNDLSDDYAFATDYVYDGEWKEVDLGVRVFGFVFEKFQDEANKTISQLQEKVKELEEEVFPSEYVEFKMKITSAVDTLLDLYNEDGVIVEGQDLTIEVWKDEEIIYVPQIRKGTYTLKNKDYMLGANGKATLLTFDGADSYDLGNVEVIKIGGVK